MRQFNVQFHGELAEQFDNNLRYVTGETLLDVMQALTVSCGHKFKQTILHGEWHVMVGEVEEENYLNAELVSFSLPKENIHIFPAVTGAGGMRGGGIGQIILGVVLIASSVVLGPQNAMLGIEGLSTGLISASMAGSLAVAGAMSMIGGVMSLIVPVPKMNYGVAQRQSFIFNGAVNNTNQGVPIPIVYGEHLTGSTVISADIQTANVNYNMLTAQQVQDGVLH